LGPRPLDRSGSTLSGASALGVVEIMRLARATRRGRSTSPAGTGWPAEVLEQTFDRWH
jgi:hypothetical protein